MKDSNFRELLRNNPKVDEKLIERVKILEKFVNKSETIGVQPSGFNIMHPMDSDIYKNTIRACSNL